MEGGLFYGGGASLLLTQILGGKCNSTIFIYSYLYNNETFKNVYRNKNFK